MRIEFKMKTSVFQIQQALFVFGYVWKAKGSTRGRSLGVSETMSSGKSNYQLTYGYINWLYHLKPKQNYGIHKVLKCVPQI